MFVLMGFIAGDRVAWRRWWFPDEATIAMSDGLLHDPSVEYTRYLNPGAARLDEYADCRGIILLADAGMGKSFELTAEIARRQAAGQHVVRLDLGTYSSAGEVKDAVRDAASAWEASGADDLVLALDGFDEPILEIRNLSDVLLRELSQLDLSRLRVLITSRRSFWRDSMADAFASWWGDQAATLTLAPLTEADIRMAVLSDGLDADAFIAAVQQAGAGPLAARPVSLRMLLAGWSKGSMPSARAEAYRLGVEYLVNENSPLRRERRQQGTPVPQRVAAASRLATVSLVTGRPRILRRSDPGGSLHEVALDQVSTTGATPDALDDVFDSAVLAGPAEARTWAHRSIEEYLCASLLASLPLGSATSLLSDPGSPEKLLPQFADTAGWLAGMSAEAMRWVVERDPAILINPDLRARADSEKRLIGQALLARLHDDEFPAVRVSYGGLAYAGLADDLRSLLADTGPFWRRREAARIITETGLRELDSELLSIVEATAAAKNPDGYDDDVQLALLAVNGLRACSEAALLDRLKATAADEQAPDLLRAEIMSILWPTHMSTSSLLEAAGSPLSPAIERRLAYTLIAAVRAGAVHLPELLAWFTAFPQTLTIGHHLSDLAGTVIGNSIATADPGTEGWRQAAALVRYQVTATGSLYGWRQDDLDRLDSDRRRALARDALMGRRDMLVIARFMAHGIIQPADLAWWLSELARGIAADPAAELSGRAVVEELARVIPAQDAAPVVAAAVAQNESLKPVTDAIFAETDTGQTDSPSGGTTAPADPAAYGRPDTFSADRLDAALTARDFPSVLLELETPALTGTQPGQTARRASAWEVLDASQQDQTLSLALDYVQRDDLDLDDWEHISSIAKAITMLQEHAPSALDKIPLAKWLSLLPKLTPTLETYRIVGVALPYAFAADPQITEERLTEELRRAAGTNAGMLAEFVRGYHFQSLGAEAISIASSDTVPPLALPALLRIAEPVLPDEMAATALSHVKRRPAADDREANAGTKENWLRAVAAAAFLAGSDQSAAVFDELLNTFRSDPAFGLTVIREAERSPRPAWRRLSADQLAALFSWGRQHLPSPSPVKPGVAVHADSAEDLPDKIIQQLAQQGETVAADVLDRLARETGDVWVKHAARTARDNARAAQWNPPPPSAIVEAISHHERRVVATAEQLAVVVLASVDELAEELALDRALRSQLWHRQRQDNKWVGYVPLTEPEFSDWLSRDLRHRIRQRVAVLREVEIQPRLSVTPADIPDLLAISIVTEGSSAELPIEVKCNWNDGVRSAIETQLGDRYLNGPHGTTGIYIVACYSGSAWLKDDSRREEAMRRDPDSLRPELDRRAQSLATRGITVHHRIVDLPLDMEPTPGASS
jgi:hypothetical protein